ncbi:MAG TPA: hypothetical protein VNF47_26870 [Streptosporangiaceae bacterium]|nr:hypothetical protein [Streptosporangiaceae bacterium]
MIDKFRDCPGCGTIREFAQHHPEPEPCPDAADSQCPEWYCIRCGTALLIGAFPVGLDAKLSGGDLAAAGGGVAAAGAGRAGRPLDRVA